MSVLIEGNDSDGKPKQLCSDRLAEIGDEGFVIIAENYLWLAAHVRGYPSDSHWRADICFEEAKRRGKPELYKLAYDRANSTVH